MPHQKSKDASRIFDEMDEMFQHDGKIIYSLAPSSKTQIKELNNGISTEIVVGKRMDSDDSDSLYEGLSYDEDEDAELDEGTGYDISKNIRVPSLPLEKLDSASYTQYVIALRCFFNQLHLLFPPSENNICDRSSVLFNGLSADDINTGTGSSINAASSEGILNTNSGTSGGGGGGGLTSFYSSQFTKLNFIPGLSHIIKPNAIGPRKSVSTLLNKAALSYLNYVIASYLKSSEEKEVKSSALTTTATATKKNSQLLSSNNKTILKGKDRTRVYDESLEQFLKRLEMDGVDWVKRGKYTYDDIFKIFETMLRNNVLASSQTLKIDENSFSVLMSKFEKLAEKVQLECSSSKKAKKHSAYTFGISATSSVINGSSNFKRQISDVNTDSINPTTISSNTGSKDDSIVNNTNNIVKRREHSNSVKHHGSSNNKPMGNPVNLKGLESPTLVSKWDPVILVQYFNICEDDHEEIFVREKRFYSVQSTIEELKMQFYTLDMNKMYTPGTFVQKTAAFEKWKDTRKKEIQTIVHHLDPEYPTLNAALPGLDLELDPSAAHGASGGALTKQESSLVQAQLIITVMSAKGLVWKPQKDNSIDPYCSIDINGSTYSTKTRPNSHDPEWNETFVVDLDTLKETSKDAIKLKLTIYDEYIPPQQTHDTFSSDASSITKTNVKSCSQGGSGGIISADNTLVTNSLSRKKSKKISKADAKSLLSSSANSSNINSTSSATSSAIVMDDIGPLPSHDSKPRRQSTYSGNSENALGLSSTSNKKNILTKVWQSSAVQNIAHGGSISNYSSHEKCLGQVIFEYTLDQLNNQEIQCGALMKKKNSAKQAGGQIYFKLVYKSKSSRIEEINLQKRDKARRELENRKNYAQTRPNYHSIYIDLCERALRYEIGNYTARSKQLRSKSAGTATNENVISMFTLSENVNLLFSEYGILYGVGRLWRSVIYFEVMTKYFLQGKLDIFSFNEVLKDICKVAKSRLRWTFDETKIYTHCIDTIDTYLYDRINNYHHCFPLSTPPHHLQAHVYAVFLLYALPYPTLTHTLTSRNVISRQGLSFKDACSAIISALDTGALSTYGRIYAITQPSSEYPSAKEVVDQFSALVAWLLDDLEKDALYFKNDFSLLSADSPPRVLLSVEHLQITSHMYRKLLASDLDRILITLFSPTTAPVPSHATSRNNGGKINLSVVKYTYHPEVMTLYHRLVTFLTQLDKLCGVPIASTTATSRGKSEVDAEDILSYNYLCARFLPYLKGWLAYTDFKARECLRRSLLNDIFEPSDVADSQYHSHSTHDLFWLVNNVYDYINRLKWTDKESLQQDILLSFCQLLSNTLKYYLGNLSLFLSDFLDITIKNGTQYGSSTSLEFTESSSNSSATNASLSSTSSSLHNSSDEPYFPSQRVCVILNNISKCDIEIQQLCRRLNYPHVYPTTYKINNDDNDENDNGKRQFLLQQDTLLYKLDPCPEINQQLLEIVELVHDQFTGSMQQLLRKIRPYIFNIFMDITLSKPIMSKAAGFFKRIFHASSSSSNKKKNPSTMINSDSAVTGASDSSFSELASYLEALLESCCVSMHPNTFQQFLLSIWLLTEDVLLSVLELGQYNSVNGIDALKSAYFRIFEYLHADGQGIPQSAFKTTYHNAITDLLDVCRQDDPDRFINMHVLTRNVSRIQTTLEAIMHKRFHRKSDVYAYLLTLEQK